MLDIIPKDIYVIDNLLANLITRPSPWHVGKACGQAFLQARGNSRTSLQILSGTSAKIIFYAGIQWCRRKWSTGTLPENNKHRNAVPACLRGHPFIITTRKSGFWPPTYTCVMRLTSAAPFWTSKCRRHKIHTTLRKQLEQWPSGPKAEVLL